VIRHLLTELLRVTLSLPQSYTNYRTEALPQTPVTPTKESHKMAKEKLTPEERRDRVRQAREEKIVAAFEGKKFEYVEEVTLEGDDRYTDVTGNKGKNGHKITNSENGEELIVGPASLKRAEAMGAITLPEKPARQAAASSEATDEDEADTSELEDDTLANV
jgi:hypothetical protein